MTHDLNDAIKVGVVATNSTDYVLTLFEQYQKGHVVILLRDEDDERITELNIQKVIVPGTGKGWLTEKVELPCSDNLAQISFTSGTEGAPKGVLLTHKSLADVTERLNDVMEVDSSIREYVGVPSNYSFGLGRFRAVLTAGGRAFLPPNGFNPIEIKEMLETSEINAISAVPSLWRVLLSNKSIFGNETLRLKWIEIGSQYMSRKEKEELKLLFPNAIIVQHYGLTEASRTTFLRIDKTDGELLESVGRSYGETEIKISEKGQICIKGPHVSQTLLVNGTVKDNINDDAWFETSDLGEINNNFLFYKGRADDQINCGGIKLSPEALERDIREAMDIKEGIAVGRVPNPSMGDGVLVVALTEANIPLSNLHAETEKLLESYGIRNKNVVVTSTLSEFPATATGKVQRSKLADLAPLPQQKNDTAKPVSKSYTATEQQIIDIWQSILKKDVTDIDQTFYEQGGDSLLVISALVEMERKGIPSDIAKGLIQGYSIREIADSIDKAKSFDQHQLKTVDSQVGMSINVVRGLLVLIVISAHWFHGIVERIFSSEAVIIVQSILQPVFSMGTPGFAVIYGIGLGYSVHDIYQKDTKRLKTILIKTFKFIGLGIIALAIVRLIAYHNELLLNTYLLESAFYSVLTYYLLASVTMLLWFRLLNIFENAAYGAFLLSICLYIFHLLFIEPLATIAMNNSVAEMLKLVFTAKYAYFLMLSGTLAGVGIGLQLTNYVEQNKPIVSLAVIGMAVLLCGFTILLHVENYTSWFEPVPTNYLWRWLVYTGVIIVLIGLFGRMLASYNNMSIYAQYPFQIFATLGVLAFPLFVLHEMVIPLKAITMFFILNDAAALVISMGLFVTIATLLFFKVFRLSYR